MAISVVSSSVISLATRILRQRALPRSFSKDGTHTFHSALTRSFHIASSIIHRLTRKCTIASHSTRCPKVVLPLFAQKEGPLRSLIWMPGLQILSLLYVTDIPRVP